MSDIYATQFNMARDFNEGDYELPDDIAKESTWKIESIETQCPACGYWRDIAGGTDHHTEPHGEGRRCVYCLGEVKG